MLVYFKIAEDPAEGGESRGVEVLLCKGQNRVLAMERQNILLQV
jgi:hypothetical protein